MTVDIRDEGRLSHERIAGLNFIRRTASRVFRQHASQGLRSHVIEVLEREAVSREQVGELRDGVRWFPRACPLRMLRIFRTRFDSRRQAEAEAGKLKTMSRYLLPSQFAASEEFLVEYRCGTRRDILLCGLQQYIQGQPLDPWTDVGLDALVARLSAGGSPVSASELRAALERNLAELVRRVRRMVAEAGVIPDLAGNQNLLVTPEGRVVLVDINNMAAVAGGDTVPVDDKGYPAVDKSIEALHRIETHLLGRPAASNDPLLSPFLAPRRRQAVAAIERAFHERFNH
jgi:hypothetical protein